MSALEYHAPQSVAEALGLLARTDRRSRVLAGGTDLLVQLRAGRVAPERIIDIKHIAGMRDIREDGRGFHIGAAVTCAEIGEHRALRRAWPGLVEGINLIGSTQIQGRATPAGNLCNASPAADSVPAMIAAGTICVIAHAGGEREVAVEDFATGPGRNCLAAGEFLVGLRVPTAPPRSSDAYLRLIPRTEMDIAVAGVGVSLTLGGDGVCSAARVAIGAVAPIALLVPDAGAALLGSRLDDSALAKAMAAARGACRPIDDKRGTAEYRIHVTGILVQRAIRIALQRIASL